MLPLLPVIFRNVWRNRRRSLLTLGSGAVSLGLLALMVALYQGFFLRADSSPSEALRVITRHKVSLATPLPASHIDRIRTVEGVTVISPWTWFQGRWREPKDFFARFAVDPEVIFKIRQDWELPPEELARFKSLRTATVVGRQISEKFGIKTGDRVTIVGDIYPVTLELTCVGVFEHPENTAALIFHRDYLRELLKAAGREADTVGTFAMLAASKEDVPRVAKAIDDLFANSPDPTRTESEKQFGLSFLAFLGNLKLFLGILCGAVTFTILLVSANTVAMSVRERTREIAILRTLGYSPTEIMGMILGESVLLSLLGAGAGVLLATGLSALTRAGGGAFPFPRIQPEAITITLAVALAIGLLSAAVPAYLASRKNLVASLRFTG